MVGSCHCGKVRFSVKDLDLNSVIECNCSHCERKGFLLAFMPLANFELMSGEAELASYKFNKQVIDHLFCKNCGVQAFAYGMDPATGAKTVAVNVRCLEDLDVAGLKRVPFDGRAI